MKPPVLEGELASAVLVLMPVLVPVAEELEASVVVVAEPVSEDASPVLVGVLESDDVAVEYPPDPAE